jgi:hypothetical protein
LTIMTAKSLACSVICALLSELTASSVSATPIEFSLASPDQIADSGDIVSFVATIDTPITTTSTIFLNADSHTEDTGPIVDDAPFLFGFPLFMNPGDSTTAVLFDVNVLPARASTMDSSTFWVARTPRKAICWEAWNTASQ